MSDKNLEELFASALLNDSTEKLKELINNKIDTIEKNFKQDISDFTDKIKDKMDKFESYVTSKPIFINFGTMEKPKERIVHQQFNKIINILKSTQRIEKNIMLVGPCASGKTSLCKDVADSLHLDFYPMSVGLQTTKSDLLGFINAHGEYMSTPIRQAFENGGLLLLDEFDATHAGVITVLNSMLANGICSFPDKIVKKNDKFICIVACNTYGKGGSVEYIGRNRLDSATLDRFICVPVEYDLQLEEKLTSNNKWFSIIKKIRENIKKHGIKVVVSPRASMQGADLLEAGFSINDVLEMVIYKGVSDDVKNKIVENIDLNINNKKENKENKPVELTIDFDNNEYTLKNLTENIAIVGNQDWEGSINMFLNIYNEFTPLLNSTGLFLNAGEHKQFDIQPNKDDILNFIKNIVEYSSSIKIDNEQKMKLTIIDNSAFNDKGCTLWL